MTAISFYSVAQNKCVYMPQVVFKCRIKMKCQRAYDLFSCVTKVCKLNEKRLLETRKINSDYDHISFYSVAQNKCVYMPQVVFKCRIKTKSQRVFHLFRCVNQSV